MNKAREQASRITAVEIVERLRLLCPEGGDLIRGLAYLFYCTNRVRRTLGDTERSYESFVQGVLTDVAQELESLRATQRELLHRITTNGRKTIAIYHKHFGWREHFGDIHKRLRARGYNVIIVLDPQNDDGSHGYEDDAYLFFGGLAIIGDISDIDLFIFSDFPPKNICRSASKMILEHFISGNVFAPRTDKSRMMAMAIAADYYVTAIDPLRSNPDREWPSLEARIPEHNFLHEGENFTIIPGGYIKLDRVVEHFSTNRRDKTILFVSTYDYLSKAPLKKYGKEIFDKLLQEFPDYRLVFRPHPVTIHTQDVQALVEQYKDNDNFELDTSSPYYDTFSRAAVVISDSSQTAVTYSLATLNSVVWCCFKDGADPTRWEESTGRLAYDTSELAQVVRSVIDNPDSMRSEIADFRAKNIEKFGEAEKYLTDAAEMVLQGRSDDRWIDFPLKRAPAIPGQYKISDESLRCMRQLFADGDPRSAMELMRINAADPEVAFVGGVIALSQNELDYAHRLLRIAKKARHRLSEVNRFLGIIKASCGDEKEARELLLESLQANPYDIQSWLATLNFCRVSNKSGLTVEKLLEKVPQDTTLKSSVDAWVSQNMPEHISKKYH